jgi:hypothetical protein
MVARAIALAMGVAGVAARFYALLQRGSLWQDEATLALNVLGRSYGALLAPLDWAQTAPPLYLWLVRATATMLGGREWTFRLWPFLAGAALLPLVWFLARRVAGAWVGAIAVSAAAGSQFAMHFAVEGKPYATDAVVAAALLCCAAVVLEAPARAVAWRWLAVAGLAGLAASASAMFVLAAIGTALLADRGLRADAAARRRLLVMGAIWIAWFGVLYVLVYRASAASAYLRDYWDVVMLHPTAPNLGSRMAWRLLELTWSPLRLTEPVVGLVAGVAAWLAGLAVVARRKPAYALLLGGPPLLTAIASVLGLYPFAGRLLLFAVPGVWIAEAAAVNWGVDRLRGIVAQIATWSGAARRAGSTPRGVVAWPAAACLLLAVLTWQDAWGFLRSPDLWPVDPTRELFDTVRERAARGHATVYVHARAAAPWVYATTDWRDPDLARLARYRAFSGAVDAPAFENLARERAVVPGDGEPLVLRAGDRVELIGLAAGIHHQHIGRPSPFVPSPGWAEEEARRLLAAADPEVWLVASHFFVGTRADELAPLLAAAREAGLEVVEELGGGDAVALRLRRSL